MRLTAVAWMIALVSCGDGGVKDDTSEPDTPTTEDTGPWTYDTGDTDTTPTTGGSGSGGSGDSGGTGTPTPPTPAPAPSEVVTGGGTGSWDFVIEPGGSGT